MSVALWRIRRLLVCREAGNVVLLTGLALLLRFIAHPGPSDIREVLMPHQSRAGWAALLYLVYGGHAPHDETIWTINRIAGALSVPLLYVVMRRRFTEPIVAVAGAAALAVTPLLVRFSASDTPYIMLCMAWLAAVVAFDSYAESYSLATFILGLALLTVAMQLRPETPWLIVPTALLALSQWSWCTFRAQLLRPSTISCALLFAAMNAVPTAWGVLQQSGSHFYPYWKEFVLIGAAVGSPWREPDMTPFGLTALVLLGAGAAFAYRYRRSGELWLAAALVAWPYRVPAARYYPFPTTPNYANARYHVPAMYLACGLVGLGIDTLFALVRRRIRRRIRIAPPLAALAAAVVVLAALPRFDLLTRMWAPQSEFEFFRRGLRSIDPNCRVVTM
ncbi:MAG: glycosyltransferase family 39 protein, partial [Mycobacteriales bacterium]